MRYVRYPGHMSETPACLHRHPPRLGEHCLQMEPTFAAQRALPDATLDSLKVCELLTHDTNVPRQIVCNLLTRYTSYFFGLIC